MQLIRNFIWRLRCPDDVDSIAADFVASVLHRTDPSSLDFESAFKDHIDPWFAWRRMIATRYGIAANYQSPNGTEAKYGWNKRLWKKHQNLSPEELVDIISHKVVDILIFNKKCKITDLAVTLQFVDSLPWKETTHAYGNAGDSPKQLRRLLSEDEDERMDAILGFLLSSVFHQCSIYPATPLSVISVIKILELGLINELSPGTEHDTMASALLDFIQLCLDRGQKNIDNPHPKVPTIEEATASGLILYEQMRQDPDPTVSSRAEALSLWVKNHYKKE